MTSRKHPSVALWITVALLVVLVAYPLSLGPWFWVASRCGEKWDYVPQIYLPILNSCGTTRLTTRAIQYYAELFAPDGWVLYRWGSEWDCGRPRAW